MENSRLLAEVLAACHQAEVGSLPLSAAHSGGGAEGFLCSQALAGPGAHTAASSLSEA